MPHIRAIFSLREKEVVRIMSNIEMKLAIRQALNKMFPRYPVEHIIIIPEPLSNEMLAFADNLLPLEFVIDIGKHFVQLDDSHSEALRKQLINFCPELNKINFGIWLREFPSNGFTEHRPP